MKSFRLLLIAILFVTILALPGKVAQAGGPTGTWASGIACQNLDNVNLANVSLVFYPQLNGTSAITYNTTIAAGASKNWLTTSGVSMPGFPSSFVGSALVTSDRAIACNVNSQSTGTGTTGDPYRIGTSAGLGSGQTASTIYIPQTIKEFSGFNSYISVQNTSATSVNVTVSYFNSAGSEIVAAQEQAAIPGYAAKVFYQNDNANLPAGFNGGAKVVSSNVGVQLATTVAIFRDAANYTRTQFLSYNGFASGSAKVFVPRFVRNLIGYNSGMAIQNVGATPTVVTVVFNFQGTQYTYTSPSIAPNTSHLLYAPSMALLAPIDALAGGLRQGSAVVSVDDLANDRIVVTVNEDNQTGEATRLGHGTTYNAPADGSQTTTVFFTQFTKAAGGIFSSGFQVSNTTTSAGTCNIVYSADPTANESNVPLPASGTIVRFAPQIVALDAGYNAAVKVTCTQAITGIVNLAAYGGKYGDSFTQTTGLNQ